MQFLLKTNILIPLLFCFARKVERVVLVSLLSDLLILKYPVCLGGRQLLELFKNYLINQLHENKLVLQGAPTDAYYICLHMDASSTPGSLCVLRKSFSSLMCSTLQPILDENISESSWVVILLLTN